ncbi:MAG: hypothetical protein CBC13_09075 [Planctomycetia bacterium TMED53]|nr:MAG: hypothetical protein CBC13_09075 [Planctomycetia bacterium TMED53]
MSDDLREDQRIQMVAVGPDDEAEKKLWLEALEGVIDQNSYCLGNAVGEFEEQCKQYLGVDHAFGVSNGTDGLKLALRAVGVNSGDEVILPAYSFFSTASVIAHLGAKPVFVDIDPKTLLIDVDQISAAITDKTRAIMPVQLYGQTAEMDTIMKLSEQTGIPVVEDAAQAFGVRYKDQPAGAIGAAGAFSFYPTKNLAAAGDAGMVVTQNEEIAEKMRRLRVHGDIGGYQHQTLGWNARMDGFQGAILSIRLERLATQQEARARNANEYLEALKSHQLTDKIETLAQTSGSDHCWHQFIIQMDDRDRIREQLSQRGIDSGIYYPGTLPGQPCFSDLGYDEGKYPVAQRAASRVLALPIHHRLQQGDPSRVVAALAELVGTATR